MKTSGNARNQQSKQGMVSKHRPEIRDNLDSREGEEQEFKGDDVTHNHKDHRNAKPKHKK